MSNAEALLARARALHLPKAITARGTPLVTAVVTAYQRVAHWQRPRPGEM